MLAAIIWAFADIWRYPSALPDKWGVAAWEYAYISLGQASINSLIWGWFQQGYALSALLWLETQAAFRNPFREADISPCCFRKLLFCLECKFC